MNNILSFIKNKKEHLFNKKSDDIKNQKYFKDKHNFLDKKVKELQAELELKETRITDLTSQNQILDSTITKLDNKILFLENDIDQLKKENHDLEQQLYSNKILLNNSKVHINQLVKDNLNLVEIINNSKQIIDEVYQLSLKSTNLSKQNSEFLTNNLTNSKDFTENKQENIERI
ncbi:hypothetical protein [Mycoplasma mycoides]|uniref:hypothetical protein n=1 Tax=Mycoplasma mycoides TaxID=2102 RepID=UPI00223F1131|nr:hypothetical protein [Mycoplasma mycoides]QVJ96015.1 hypothetical protein I7632_03200 [Mycoplasma mycoides subsp. capri]QVJ96909.1 hypothetical protein I7633_03155 [Mycoplasma mycoides subsp. capri]QVK00772.1 hypothetical protein I7635_03150 [Mycoplasma mycoides subsp. capri]